MAYENEPGNDGRATVERTAGKSHSVLSTSRATHSRHYHLPIWATVAVSVGCMIILLTTALIPNPGAIRSNTGSSGMKDALSNPAPPGEFPYLVAPEFYPNPSNFTPGGAPAFVRLAALSSGADYLLFASHDDSQLWLSSGGYSSTDAENYFLGKTSQAVYVNWGSPVQVYSTTGTIAADALASTGSSLVIGVTSGSTTTILSTSTGGAPFSTLGSVAGTLTSLAANPQSVLATTIGSGTLTAATLSLGGTTLNSVSVGPTGGVQNASAAWVANSMGAEIESIVTSQPRTASLVEYTSASAGQSFTGTTIGYLNETTPSTVLNSIGLTRLTPSGGTVGQVASISVGNGVFVLYTNRTSSGRVIAETMVSPDTGNHWNGPYSAPTPSGSVQNPTLAVDPDGDVVATWQDNGNGSWQLDQAVFSSNGNLRAAPAALPASGGNSLSPFSAGPPSVTVDSLGRPLYAWPAPTSAGPGIDYSGDFLSASNALTILQNLVNDPLLPSDFGVGTTQAGENSDVTTIDGSLATTSTAMGESNKAQALSQAQNDTISDVVPLVTHITLKVTAPGGWAAEPTNKSSAIAASLGTFSPNVYFAVYAAQLINALGGAIQGSPLQSANAFGAFSGPQPPPAFSGNNSRDHPYENLTTWVYITATPQSPDAILLASSTGTHWPEYTDYIPAEGSCDGHPGHYEVEDYSVAVKYWSNVSLAGGTPKSFSSTSGLPSVYLTNLTANTNVTWYGNWTGAYAEYTHYVWCGQNVTQQLTQDQLGPPSTTIAVNGYTLTTLGIIPGQPYLLNGTWNGRTTPTKLTTDWTNSMLAQDSIWLNYSGTHQTAAHWPSAGSGVNSSQGYVIGLNPYPIFYNLPNASYTGQIYAQSQAGTYTMSERPAVSGGNLNSYPPQQASYSCNFNLAPPTYTITWPSGGPITNNTTTTSTAQVTWFANQEGLGLVFYYEYWTGINYTTSNVSAIWNASAKLWEYSVVLHNLDSFALYNVTVGVGVGSGCIEKTLVRSYNFYTPHVLTLREYDDPYDSITQTGGGATLTWNLPQLFARTSTFVSGVLFWYANGSTYELQLSNVNEFQGPPTVGTVNIPGLLGLGTTCEAWVDLNYTQQGNHALSVTSVPVWFDYLRDTSGDGLTDLEKGLGWANPIAPGYFVTASPALYATNGLVNDYLEKKYDLIPNTIDTAGSHMLDTWNLTFDLGHNTPSGCPADFRCWYENRSSPFNYSVTPAGNPPPHDQPLVNNTTSVAHWTRGGLQDDAPYDAEVLWKGSALSVLQQLIVSEGVGWLRGVMMRYPTTGNWTLTVWGKLSWGANPLVASTPGNGGVDGARVNPVYSEDVQLNFGLLGHGLTGIAGINYGTCGSVPAGSAYALRFWVNGTEKAPVSEVKGWFSQQVNITHNNASCGHIDFGNPVQWTFPVDNSVQFQRISLQMLLNVSGSTPTLVPLKVNGSSIWANFSLDLLNSPPLSYYNTTQGLWQPWFQFGGSSGYDGTATVMIFGLTALWAGARAPTFLWRPDDNSTLSPLPAGLQRYTGAENFALLVVNSSANQSLSGVPTPWGSSYSLRLQLGLNNILVPIGVLANSTIGQALLEDRAMPDSNGATPPLLQTSLAGGLVDGSGSATVSDLACYWQNRALSSTSSVTPLCSARHSSDKGVPISSGLLMTILNATPNGCTINCGTVPTNPGVESGTNSLPALGALIAVNVTNASMGYALLAGVLDNSTGGINGTFTPLQPYQIATLGLPSVVLDTLANNSTSNTPIFGPPASKLVQTENSCSGWLGCAAQAWNSFAGDVVSGLTIVATFAWSIYIAPYVYLGDLIIAGAKLFFEYVIQSNIAALELIGPLIVSAFSSLINWLSTDVIVPLLTAVFGPVIAAMNTYVENLAANLGSAATDYYAGHSVAPDAARFWINVTGPVFYFTLAVAVALTVVFTIMDTLSLGAGFLIPIVIGIIMSGSSAAIALKGGPSYLQQFRSINPVSPSMVAEWKTITGWTQTAANTPGWFLGGLAAILGITTTSVAATNALDAWENGYIPDWTDTWGTNFGILSIIAAGVAAYYSSIGAAVVSTAFDGVSIVLDGVSLFEEPRLQNGLVMVMDGCAFALDFHVATT